MINVFTNDARSTPSSVVTQLDLNGLLERIAVLQQHVNTEPLLRQNEQLQQELRDTKKLVQAAKAQLDKPVPKATLEASLTDKWEQASNVKTIKVQRQPDGSVEFTVYVINTSDNQARNGTILVRICQACTYLAEPERFQKIPGAADTDREMQRVQVEGKLIVAIPLKVMPPLSVSGELEVKVTSRCETCVFRPSDILRVSY